MHGPELNFDLGGKKSKEKKKIENIVITRKKLNKDFILENTFALMLTFLNVTTVLWLRRDYYADGMSNICNLPPHSATVK